MLVTLKEILKIANERKCAIGSFNTPNMATIKAVIGGAEEMNEPVIIMHAQVHEEMGVCKMSEIAPVMLNMADKAKVPVCVHLDHGTDLGYVKKAIESGFTSVMYDGSELQTFMNYVNTSVAVKLAEKTGASVEAEIGSMGKREGGGGEGTSIYTDPDEAKDFAEKTGIDALACAFGTAHGMYLKKPKLDFERLETIKSKVQIPLVMHGGSGVSPEDYTRAIKCGIRKINYYTYMANAGGRAVEKLFRKTYYHDIELAAIEAMKDDVKTAINVFSGQNRPGL